VTRSPLLTTSTLALAFRDRADKLGLALMEGYSWT
jgi:hypothetical protein